MLDCEVIHCFLPYDGFMLVFFSFLVESQDVRHGDQQIALKEYGGMSN